MVLLDHNNLKYFMTKKKLTSRQARWAEGLAKFDFRIKYRAGSKNLADGPSRRPDYSKPEESINDGMLPTLQNKLRIAALYPRALSQRILASIPSEREE